MAEPDPYAEFYGEPDPYAEFYDEAPAPPSALERLKAAKPRPPAKDPGLLSTVGHGLLQGFFKGGSDEAIGAFTRMRVSPGGGAAWRQPDGSVVPLETGWDVYRAGRDTERERLQGARENRPKTAMAAELLGDLASDYFINKAFPGAGVGNRAYNISTGALSGLLGSEAELTPDKATDESVVRALAQASIGGYAGKYGTDIGELATRATPATLRAIRGWLERRGINFGRRALMSGSGQLANTRPVADEAVREALESGAILPFGTTQGAAQRLEREAERQGAVYGETIADLERLGVQGPDAEVLARRLLEEGDAAARVSGANKAVPETFWKNAENIRNMVNEPEALDALARLRLAQMNVTSVQPLPSAAQSASPGGIFESILRGESQPLTQTEGAMDALRRLRLAQAGVTPPPQRTVRTPEIEPPLPAPVPAVATARNLPLSQAEGLKRTLQGEAKYGKIEDTPINEAKRDVARAVREGIEQRVDEAAMAAPPGSELDAMAGAFQPVKERLSRTLSASEAADKGAAAAAKRAGLSLTDYLWMAGGGIGGLAGSDERGGAAGAIASLLGHRLLRNRGPSTAAATSYWLSRLAGASANAAAGSPAMTRRIESLLASKALEGQAAPLGTTDNQSRVQSALSRYLYGLKPQETP